MLLLEITPCWIYRQGGGGVDGTAVDATAVVSGLWHKDTRVRTHMQPRGRRLQLAVRKVRRLTTTCEQQEEKIENTIHCCRRRYRPIPLNFGSPKAT